MNTQKSNQAPLATVVVVVRESFNMFADVVKRIYDVSTEPFQMLVMEGHAPANRRRELEALARQHPACKIIYSDKWKFPHELVNEAIPLIKTKYACFIDNDVEVLEGWLENLVRTAEEKMAHCVHPIYLTVKLSDPKRTIHIAEGKWFKEQRGDKVFMDTIASYSGVALEDYPDKEPKHSDYFEWHCVMFSKELLDNVGPLNDMNIAEHMDYALRIQKAGYEIWIEPKAVVAYDYARIWELRGADRRYLLWRWDIQKAVESSEQLHRRWNLDPESSVRRLHFAKEHTAKVRSMSVPRRMVNKLRRMVGLGILPVEVKEKKPYTASQKAQDAHLASVIRTK